MEHTEFYSHDMPPEADEAVGYAGWLQPAQAIASYDTSALGGMLVTSAAEYSRFMQALYGGSILSAASIARLTAAALVFKQPTSVSLGMTQVAVTGAGDIVSRPGGHLVIWSGYQLGTIGMGAATLYMPDSHIAMTVFDNYLAGAPSDLLAQVVARFWGPQGSR